MKSRVDWSDVGLIRPSWLTEDWKFSHASFISLRYDAYESAPSTMATVLPPGFLKSFFSCLSADPSAPGIICNSLASPPTSIAAAAAPWVGSSLLTRLYLATSVASISAYLRVFQLAANHAPVSRYLSMPLTQANFCSYPRTWDRLPLPYTCSSMPTTSETSALEPSRPLSVGVSTLKTSFGDIEFRS